MRLIDLDAKEPYLLDGRYAIGVLDNAQTVELLKPLTELCNRYCKTCPVMGEKPNPNDCTDCICTHIRGIIEVQKNELF